MEIPASDVDASAGFYAKVFGWGIRVRGDGERAFDDATGAVSGSWVLGRPPGREAGVLTYVMVDSIDTTLQKVAATGGEIVASSTPIGASGAAFATFRDPAGNLLGLYQEGAA
jgi:predicted enzyme related to lactoylglutathione lyase